MNWFQELDLSLLRFVNQTCSSSFLDWLMPFASGNQYFFPILVVLGLVLLWKGGVRARLCALMLALILWPGDSYVSNTIKKAVGRPRPFVHEDVRMPASRNFRETGAVEDKQAGAEATAVPARKPAYNSMPSSHASNWFAATMILLVYYRRSLWVMLPLACLVAVSRVYNGVHYPSDVLAGAILGAGYAAAGMWAIESLWRFAGRRWFPLWWARMPSFLNPSNPAAGDIEESPAPPADAPNVGIEVHWLRLGYALIALLFVVNALYLASGNIELSGDEAYQWVWSKHLALSYYSKPPMIAYTQWLGTTLWGDNEFGVRFFAPVISAVLGILVLRFFAREANARAGFFLLLILSTTPLLAVGSVLMTVDPLSVLFWTAAMMSGWRAIQPRGTTSSWIWTGIWMGLGFLSKYTALFQWLCWAVLFSLWKPARSHLRRPGPYLALVINLIFALPVLIWNHQHGWITVRHVAMDNAGMDEPWKFTLRYLLDFVVTETFLLNPVYFIASVWACVAFWRFGKHDPRRIFLFSMGAPLFLAYLLFSFRSRVLPNWIAPSVVPLFCLMAMFWDTRWRLGARGPKPWLITGLAIGFMMVFVLHDTGVVGKLVGNKLPPKVDPFTRVRSHSETARVVNEARLALMAEGKPVFIIGSHYQMTGLLSFYIPEARTNVVNDPLVYYVSTASPRNQFYFWPGYRERRKGQNAIFVRELSTPPLVRDWVPRWLAGETNLSARAAEGKPVPAVLFDEFESVTEIGQVHALYRGRVFHTLQLFECRNLK